MSIQIKTVTIVSCDGSEDRSCPRESSASYPYSQAIALRMARKEGWSVDGFTVCPCCSSTPVAPSQPCLPPLTGHRLARVISNHDGANEVQDHLHAQAASRSIGSSSASWS